MRKFLFIILLLIIAFHFYGDENPLVDAFSCYNPIYIITGIGDDQVKIQLSLKYDVFYTYKIGFYIGYTQLMFWDLYELSAPFRDIDFNVDFFLRFESGNNFANDFVIPYIDYFQLSLWDHKSNGMPESGDLSRAIDRIYFQFQTSFGQQYRFGLNFKYFYVFDLQFHGKENDNPDIQDYIGSFVCKLFFNLYNKQHDDYMGLYGEFAAGGGINGFDFIDNGFLEIGLTSFHLFSRFRIYAQYYQGYYESLLNYNVLTENVITHSDGGETVLPFSLRVGVILE